MRARTGSLHLRFQDISRQCSVHVNSRQIKVPLCRLETSTVQLGALHFHLFSQAQPGIKFTSGEAELVGALYRQSFQQNSCGCCSLSEAAASAPIGGEELPATVMCLRILRDFPHIFPIFSLYFHIHVPHIFPTLCGNRMVFPSFFPRFPLAPHWNHWRRTSVRQHQSWVPPQWPEWLGPPELLALPAKCWMQRAPLTRSVLI